MAQLRIALVLPGEASLGAYEAGAVSALLAGVQALNAAKPRAVAVDVISGSSSGALTAVLAARVLLSGDHPVNALHRAWVREPSVKALRSRDRRAPLSLERAREVAYELLTARPEPVGPAQDDKRDAVTLTFALTSLRGLEYKVRWMQLQNSRHLGRPVTETCELGATTYVDWARFCFKNPAFTDEWGSAIDAAIASASHPLAFAPALLDRQGSRGEYVQKGIANLPEEPDLEFWYADGGLIDRQPLGRCLDVVAERDRELGRDAGRRLVLLVHTDCDVAPSGADLSWTDAEDAPDWSATLGRTLRVICSHSVYEDLRRAQKTNNRLQWLRWAAAALSTHLAAVDGDELRATLKQQFTCIGEEKAVLSPKEPPGTLPDTSGPLENVIEDLLLAAAGIQSKFHVDLAEVVGSATEVAGSSLAGFGGFFAERPRAHDFLLGYRDTVKWMKTDLGVYTSNPEIAVTAARARGAAVPGWLGGRGDVLRPALRSRAQAVGLGARALGISLRERIGRE